MSTSPFVRKFVRACFAQRALVLLCLGLLLGAALLPHASHGMRPQDEDSLAPVNNNEAKKRDQAFVPGEILVRFRKDAFAKGSAAAQEGGASNITLRAAGGGREINARVERLGEAEIVEGLRLAHVGAEETLEAVEAFRARADVLYAEPNYRRYRIKTDGTVWAWGGNNQGQLGDGTRDARRMPVRVQALAGIVSIDAAGDNVYSEKGSFSVAVGDDGTVWGWGNNASGQRPRRQRQCESLDARAGARPQQHRPHRRGTRFEHRPQF